MFSDEKFIYLAVSISLKMASTKLSEQEFRRFLAEARKDPQFIKDIQKFIKITTGSYKLKDYGLEN